MSGKWDEWKAEIIAEWPPCPCKICGVTIEVREYPYEKLGVCNQCCIDLANVHTAYHAGEWYHPERVTPQVNQLIGYRVFDRSKKKAQKQKISKALALKVYERDGFKCVYCKAKKNLSCDHVTPESKGGETTVSNLVTACRSCNSRKQTKSLSDFWGAMQ